MTHTPDLKKRIKSVLAYSGNPEEDVLGVCAEMALIIKELTAREEKLAEALEGLYYQALDTKGVIDEFVDMPCKSLQDKFPTTSIRLNYKLDKARLILKMLKQQS